MDLLSGHDQGEMLPIPITSPYVVGAVVGHHHHLHDQQQPSSINGPLPSPPPHPPLSAEFNKGPQVKYKECLKNHAASLGGIATDGCGEFMPSGAEDTLEALKCSACTCHRNFHRKEVDGEPSTFHHHHPLLKFPPPSSTRLLPPPPHHHHMIMPLGALHASESDDMEGMASMARGPSAPPPAKKKRFRTKFTPEQKERMLQFAERAGWRLQRLEEGMVQQFCQEIGVKRRVLKVWMHNNKHNLARKTSGSLQIE